MKYIELFPKKPIIAMLHLKPSGSMDMLTRAKKEIEIFYENGVDAVLVENYFGTAEDCETALAYLSEQYPQKIYGINILGNYREAFRLADLYGAKFIQIDSVCGHLDVVSDKAYGAELNTLRKNSSALVFGGVRFKYQPECSGRTLKEDLEIGCERCDAIVVTGPGTGQNTNIKKINNFRSIINDFPLIVGAGMTLESCGEQFPISDGVIVGSYLKINGVADNEVDAERVRKFVQACREAKIN